MSAQKEMLLFLPSVGSTSQKAPSRTSNLSPCNRHPRREQLLKKFGLSQLIWSFPLKTR